MLEHSVTSAQTEQAMQYAAGAAASTARRALHGLSECLLGLMRHVEFGVEQAMPWSAAG